MGVVLEVMLSLGIVSMELGAEERETYSLGSGRRVTEAPGKSPGGGGLEEEKGEGHDNGSDSAAEVSSGHMMDNEDLLGEHLEGVK